MPPSSEDSHNILDELTKSPEVVQKLPKILEHLTSTDVQTLQLAKEVANQAFSEECKKGDLLEQRAFGLMQFAKVGLTTVAGVAGVMTIGNMSDSSFRECLLFWLLVSSCYLSKLFYRGAGVINEGTFFRPHPNTLHRPDHLDVYWTQTHPDFVAALKNHVGMMLFYLSKHVRENAIRGHHYKCCFVNTCGFLSAIFIFAAMIVAHQLWPHLILVPPGHQLIGAGLLAFALFTDVLWAKLLEQQKKGE